MSYPGKGLSTASEDYKEVDYGHYNLGVLGIDSYKTCDNPVFFVRCHTQAQVRRFVQHLNALMPLNHGKTHNLLFDPDEMQSDTTEYPVRFIAVVEDEDPDREHRVTVMLEDAAKFQASATPLRLLSHMLLLAEGDEDDKEDDDAGEEYYPHTVV